MIPVIFINCSRFPFLTWILLRRKLYETRSRNMLGRFAGCRVILAETGNGRPVAHCTAVIAAPLVIRSRSAFRSLRRSACIMKGSKYDWNLETNVKYFYPLLDVQPLEPFPVPEGVRHGRVWMEYIPDHNMEV